MKRFQGKFKNVTTLLQSEAISEYSEAIPTCTRIASLFLLAMTTSVRHDDMSCDVQSLGKEVYNPRGGRYTIPGEGDAQSLGSECVIPVET
jgi:hypothetical protein